MSWPTTGVLDLLVEMQLSTMEWVDITSYCYGIPDSQEITTQRGRSAEAFSVEPSQANLRLKNNDGRFSPRNPRGPWYGKFGRNSPLRVAVRPRLTSGAVADLSDTFNRTVAAGNTWGASDTGQTWNRTSATAANKLSVSGGTGRHLVSLTSEAPGSLLASVLYKDFDAYMTFTLPVATGDSLFSTISSRVTESGDSDRGARLRCEVTTAGVVKLLVISTNPEGGSATVSTTTVSGLTHTGQALRMRFKLSGVTVMGKVWDASGSEPSSWQVTQDETTTRIAKAPGSIVITTQAGSGNTNVPFTAQYDNVSLTAIEPRFCGELTSIPNRWTSGAPNSGAVWVPVVANGVLGRLSNTREQAKSAMWRFIEQNQTGLQGYYPLNTGENSGIPPIQFQFAILGSPLGNGRTSGPGAAVFYNTAGTGTLGGGWLEPGVQLSGPANEFLVLDRLNVPANSGAGWSLDWVRAGGQTAAGTEVVNIDTDNVTITVFWSLAFQNSGTSTNLVITDPNGTTHTASLASTGVYDGSAHHLRFTTAKSGSNITYNFYVDGTSLISGSIVAPDANGAAALESVTFQNDDTLVPVKIGHLAVWDTSAASVVSAADAALGHPGELAADRIIRLCQEQDLAYYVLASSTQGETCGPQPIGSTYDVVTAAAAADQGVLTELRDANGLLYYGRSTLYHQSATALTYSTDGHLELVPEPTDDNYFVINRSTVTRQFANSKTFEQTTGPLGSAAPPAGAGVKAGDVTLNTVNDVRTLHAAEWLVALGTVDDSRWPAITVSLAHLALHGLTSLFTSVMRTDLGYRLTVASPPTFLPPGTIDQIVLGLSETFSQYTWRTEFHCGPYETYRVGIWSGTARTYKWDAGNSTLAANATSSATSLSVATSSGSLWTTSAGDFPFDINVSGVRITVTNITGAASPQTFTVTRSVDGFDVALTAGAKVSLWTASKWGL